MKDGEGSCTDAKDLRVHDSDQQKCLKHATFYIFSAVEVD